MREAHRFRATFLLIPFAVLIAVAGCDGGNHRPYRGAEHAALELFELARSGDPQPAELQRLFGSSPQGGDPAGLREALSRVGSYEKVGVLRRVPLSDVGRVAIDLAAELPGGGSAEFSVQLEPLEGGAWRIHSFGGPGVEWPLPSRPRSLAPQRAREDLRSRFG